MTKQDRFFRAGGTLGDDDPSYIEREADGKLLELLDQNELCLVLAPRQTGKSSLMVHAMPGLKARGIRSGIVDLQSLGTRHDPNDWFGDVVFQIGRTLRMKTDTISWWKANEGLGPTQRFMVFLEDFVLVEIPGRVAVFFDEIDSVLPLPFSDDVFTTIRY